MMNYRLTHTGWIWSMLLGLFLGTTAAGAQVAQVTRLAGYVVVRAAGEVEFQPLADSVELDLEGLVKTGADGLARIRYSDGTEVTVRPGSEVMTGGIAREGTQVRVGQVLIRVGRLLESEERSFRTPIAVAAIRGTEFGISVEPDGESSIYVFDGKVAVSNAQIPDQEVLVGAGQMTVVRPLQPPTTPAPFQTQEFDRLGRLDLLERGEDPVLEASEDPAVESYLAFPDPDIDALRNPAYMSESRGRRSTTVTSVHGLKSRERLTSGPVKRDATHFSGYGISGQQVDLLQMRDNGWLGFAASGNASSEEATVVTRTPFTPEPTQSQQTSDNRVGRVGAMAAGRLGNVGLGVGATYRRSRIEVDDRPVDGGPVESTLTKNRLFAIQGGGVLKPGEARTLGLGFTHQFLKNETDAGALHKEFTGYNHFWEALYRRPVAAHRLGSIARVEHTRTTEDVSESGAAIYHEKRSVWALKGGSGIGMMPSRAMVLGIDLVGSCSRETATQFLPDGGIREDEKDMRFAGTLHLGAQISLLRSLLLTFDVTHQASWQDMDFLLMPGTDQEREDETITTQFNSSAITGIGIVRERFVAEYFISTGGDGGRPLAHNLLLVVEL